MLLNVSVEENKGRCEFFDWLVEMIWPGSGLCCPREMDTPALPKAFTQMLINMRKEFVGGKPYMQARMTWRSWQPNRLLSK